MPKPRKTLTDYVIEAAATRPPAEVIAEFKLIIGLLERLERLARMKEVNPAGEQPPLRKKGRPAKLETEGGGE